MIAIITWIVEILLSFLIFLLRPDFCETWGFVNGIAYTCVLWIPALWIGWVLK